MATVFGISNNLTDERVLPLNQRAIVTNYRAGLLRDTVMSERGPTVVHSRAGLATDAPVAFRTGSFDDLRILRDKLTSAGIDPILPICHGNALMS